MGSESATVDLRGDPGSSVTLFPSPFKTNRSGPSTTIASGPSNWYARPEITRWSFPVLALSS
jgi:hypothetical protein